MDRQFYFVFGGIHFPIALQESKFAKPFHKNTIRKFRLAGHLPVFRPISR